MLRDRLRKICGAGPIWGLRFLLTRIVRSLGAALPLFANKKINTIVFNRKSYMWFYDNIHCHYYNILMKWCFLPFGGERRCRHVLIEPVTFGSADRILDMCCGTGGATFAIAEKAGEEADTIGIDVSWGQLRIAQKSVDQLAAREHRFNSVKFIEGDVTKAPFKNGYFDKVFITHALHEMEREQRLETLKEAKRMLRQKGKVITLEVNDPKNPLVRLFIGFWFFYWLPFNFETPTRRDMLKHGLESEIKEAGFRNVRKISSHQGVLQLVEGEN